MRPFILTAGVAAIALLAGQPHAAVAHPGHDQDQLSVPAAKAGRAKPLVAIVAGNDGAEITDFTIPYGVLKNSGVAEVRSLSSKPGPVQLFRSVRIVADQSLAQFDAAEPAGADIVIVPAQMSPKDKALIAWVQAQAGKGATIVSVCEGARVLANAGLLKGKRAVTHWSAIEGLSKSSPDTTWVRDRRYLQDGRIISTTGVTASIPMSLALVEAIGGHAAADVTAARFGVTGWSSQHRTADFVLTKEDTAAAMKNLAAVWSHETVEAPIADGVDEVALALRADVWARSYRTKVVTTNAGRTPVRSRHGLTILPDDQPQPGRYVIPGGVGPAMPQLEAAMASMGERYGPAEVRLAKIGLEYTPPTARHD